MDKKSLLLSKIENVPETILDEIIDFVRFLKENLQITARLIIHNPYYHNSPSYRF